jgi:hypothetical protein
LKEVSAILNAKAPQDAAGFKAWLQTISENVAEASSEGGFLGIGGVKVSDVGIRNGAVEFGRRSRPASDTFSWGSWSGGCGITEPPSH